MKTHVSIIVASLLVATLPASMRAAPPKAAAEPGTATTLHVRPTLDRSSLLRNPATGWILYDDAPGRVARAGAYWKAMDKPARDHASIFYIRWRWAEAEPEEGRYAWLYDDNFKGLIQGARDRGLRLAFRFYVASRDNISQGTPPYVREAGAQGAMQKGQGGKDLWSPYIDDPVFQEKFDTFIAAFAREFDDPARVDFIDALGLGWWGEGHHLNLKDPANTRAVYRWILDAYSKRFSHVLLGMQHRTGFGWELDEEWAIRGEDYIVRRDGLGSHWFNDHQRARIKALFPRHPLYGERCYWGGGAKIPDIMAKQDPRFGHRFKSWRDMDAIAIDDALEHHANTLDLRTLGDVRWFLTYPELIERFKREGGYRLAPVDVRCTRIPAPGTAFTIEHTWVNLGVGVLPNHNRRWAHKYRPAFAVIPEGAKQPVAEWVDHAAEPGDWLRGTEYKHALRCSLAKDTPPGNYTLVCAILNTHKDGMPHLQLAADLPQAAHWYRLGRVVVEARKK